MSGPRARGAPPLVWLRRGERGAGRARRVQLVVQVAEGEVRQRGRRAATAAAAAAAAFVGSVREGAEEGVRKQRAALLGGEGDDGRRAARVENNCVLIEDMSQKKGMS